MPARATKPAVPAERAPRSGRGERRERSERNGDGGRERGGDTARDAQGEASPNSAPNERGARSGRGEDRPPRGERGDGRRERRSDAPARLPEARGSADSAMPEAGVGRRLRRPGQRRPGRGGTAP